MAILQHMYYLMSIGDAHLLLEVANIQIYLEVGGKVSQERMVDRVFLIQTHLFHQLPVVACPLRVEVATITRKQLLLQQ